MADRLDGQRLNDGRFFQVTPGKHELVVRFDFEVYSRRFQHRPTGTHLLPEDSLRRLPGRQRYRIEARARPCSPVPIWRDAQRKLVAEEQNDIFCIP